MRDVYIGFIVNTMKFCTVPKAASKEKNFVDKTNLGAIRSWSCLNK